MTFVAILPSEWDIDYAPPLRRYWKQQQRDDALIPLRLALDWFRPTMSIDCTQEPPVIGPYVKESHA